ncbi:poly + rna export protein [Phlyctema vagabunda]|uniref:Poly + rna export protein n=1 Tax=Phlyctema vagabunda TaxID=108571 RepID=A0ABR4PQT7_9HELO
MAPLRTATTSLPGDVSKDVTLADPPSDSISALKFSPANDHLAVASWDHKVRIYDLTSKPTGVGIAIMPFDGPVLDCHWSKDGRTIVGSSSDRTARILDLAQSGSPARQVAIHDAPVRSVRFVQTTAMAAPMIATGSWDKTVKYWDHRASNASPVMEASCQERVYSMDTYDNILVVATAERYINYIDLKAPSTLMRTIMSPLQHQTRVVTCFNTNTIGVGSTGGRLAIQHLKIIGTKDNFSFKCHRHLRIGSSNMTDVYALNDVSLHPNGMFSTAGADGTFNFWNWISKTRLKHFNTGTNSISATAFSKTGDLFAYAISYDWSKGYAHNTTEHPLNVMLHNVTTDESTRL